MTPEATLPGAAPIVALALLVPLLATVPAAGTAPSDSAHAGDAGADRLRREP